MHSEHLIQAAYFAELAIKARRDPIYNMIFAVPNGGKRHISVARYLKAEGVKAGVPDVVGLIPNKKYHGFVLEFKTAKSRATKSQKVWLASLADLGYCAAIVRSADEAIRVTDSYINNR